MQRRTRVRDETRKSRPLAHLAADGEDPALQRRLEHLATAEHDSSRGFRKAWDRFWFAVFVGR